MGILFIVTDKDNSIFEWRVASSYIPRHGETVRDERNDEYIVGEVIYKFDCDNFKEVVVYLDYLNR